MTSATAPSVSITDHDDERTVVVRGSITEATDFGPALVPGPVRVTIDLAHVDRVNSYGVREWIRFLKSLTDRGATITLDTVSVPMVRQMNMIPQARGNAVVRRVFAPYYCSQCDDEQRLAMPDGATSAPDEAPCPACGAAMEFDDVPDAYFAFQAGGSGR